MNFNPDGYEIIDAHVHPPTEIPGTDISLFGTGNDPDSMVSTLRAAGIGMACGSVIRRMERDALTFADIHELNTAALRVRDRHPDFFIPGITVHPRFPEESCRELEDMALRHGVRLVGELVAYHMGYDDFLVPGMDEILALIRDLDLAVNLHLNRLEEAVEILRRFPTLKLIVAHPTLSQADFRSRLEVIRDYPNTALDISGSGPNMWGMVRFGIRTAGLEKIVFGTDFPLRNPGMYVAGVYAEDLTAEERRAVFSGNIRRLLRLDS